MRYKIFCLFLFFIVCISPDSVLAINCTEEEAINWILNLVKTGWGTENNTPNYDNSEWKVGDLGEPQCVDLTKAYMDYLSGKHLNGDANTYLNQKLPEGFSHSDEPHVGDIAIWANSDYGHVGVVYAIDENGIHFVDTNGDYDSYTDKDGKRHNTGARTRIRESATKYIHPEFDKIPPEITSDEITISNITYDHFTISFNATDNVGIDDVYASIKPMCEPDITMLADGTYDPETQTASIDFDVQYKGYKSCEAADVTCSVLCENYGVTGYVKDAADNVSYIDSTESFSIYQLNTSDAGSYEARVDAKVRFAPRESFNGYPTYTDDNVIKKSRIVNVLGSLIGENGTKYYKIDNRWVLADDMILKEKNSDPESPSSGSITIHGNRNVEETAPIQVQIFDPVEYNNFSIRTFNGPSGYGVYIADFNGSDGFVDVPKTINNVPVVAIQPAAFRGNTDITAVKIPSTVDIGNGAFQNCTNLTSVDLGNRSLASLDMIKTASVNFLKPAVSMDLSIAGSSDGTQIIGDYAFSGCDALKEILIPDSVILIGSSAFPTTTTIQVNCGSYAAQWAEENGYSFEYLNGPCQPSTPVYTGTCGINVKYYTQGETIVFEKEDDGVDALFKSDCVSIFRNDPGITKLTINAPVSIEDGSNLFNSASYITEMDLSGLDVSETTDFSGMFYGCTSLTSLNVIGWNTSNVTSLYNTFRNSSSLLSLDLSSWDTSKVTDMTFIFSGCSALTDLDLSGWNFSAVKTNHWNPGHTILSELFRDTRPLSSLRRLNLSGWNISDILGTADSIYGLFDDVLQDLNSLESLNLSDWDISNVTKLSGLFGRFWGSSQLINLDLSGWDVSKVTDMSYMFRGQSSIINLNLSDRNVSKVTNMSQMFSGCTSLTVLDLSNWDVSNTVDMSNMFNGCSSLVNLNMSNWIISDKTSISGRVFNGMTSLKSLDLSSWNTSEVTKMVSMFEGLTTIVSLDLHGWDVSNVTDMRSMFKGSSSLENLDISGWNVSAETNIYYMFNGCSSLVTLNMKNWNTSNITNLSGMFSGLSQLQNINLDGWDFSNVTDMSRMFSGCTSLKNLDVSSWNISNVNLDFMFSGCTSLTNLDLSSWDVSNVLSMGGIFSGCSSLRTLDLSGWQISNEMIMSKMFDGCASLTNLDLSSWDVSKKTNMRYMFESMLDSSSVTTLNLSGWDTSNVTDMSSMFDGCSLLTDLNLNRWDTSSVTDMSNMFSGCSSLSSLNLNGWDTPNVTNMYQMFGGCSVIRSLDLSMLDTSGVTNMIGMFENCSSLIDLNVSGWDTSSLTDMNEMFKNCSSLVSLDLSNWNTSKLNYSFGEEFRNCKSLNKITLGQNSANFKNIGHNIYAGTNVIDGINNKMWIYQAVGEAATNPLPLGTIKGDELFTAYDPSTMAGVWTVKNTDPSLPDSAQTYIVRDGDSCWSIAEDHGVDFELFMQTNNFSACNISIGGEVVIPVATDKSAETISATGSTLYDHCQQAWQGFIVRLPESIVISIGTPLPYGTGTDTASVIYSETRDDVPSNQYWFATRKCLNTDCTELSFTDAYLHAITMTDGVSSSGTYTNQGREGRSLTRMNMKAFGADSKPFSIIGLIAAVPEPGTYVYYAFVPYTEKENLNPQNYYARIILTVNDTDSLETCSSLANNGYFETAAVDKTAQIIQFSHIEGKDEAWISNNSPLPLDFPFSAEKTEFAENMSIASLNCKFEALEAGVLTGDGSCSPTNIHVPAHTKVTITGGALRFENGIINGDYQTAFMRTDTQNVTHLFISVTGEPSNIPGDMDGDGKVNARDVLLLRDYFLKRGIGVIIIGNPDVDLSGAVNARDVLLLRDFFLKRGIGVVIY